MIKHRVWDTAQRKYIDSGDVSINGDGVLSVVGIEGKYHTLVQSPNDLSPCFIIEQYTGLKDKNGVEIAVGDILKRRTPNYKKEVFEDQYGVVKYKNGGFYIDFSGDSDTLTMAFGEPEVSGNIHENADLLEEG